MPCLALKFSATRRKSPNNHINTITSRDNYEEKLKRALKLLAQELNSTPHHFLLELLQNADDNKYDDPQPTLTFVYTAKNHLRVHCNERGFSSADVDAICDISNSTKLTSATTTGENGIGFKSLFRVASTVWIASGNYRFKLHSDNSLKPEEFQLPFPDGSLANNGGTCMYLEILEERASEVLSAIENFDPTNILFLKTVERINIKVKDMPPRQIRRISESMGNGVSKITIIEDELPLLHYKQMSFSVEPTAERSRRRHITKSHIKLAFPVTEDFQRVICRDEKVYACLPIADFGFKFAIHADFEVTVNRQSIHDDRKWNQQLRDAIPVKFGEAIELLNKHDSSMCYSWPLLLNSAPRSGEFFHPTIGMILKELKKRPILKTEMGDSILPTESRLVRFPTKWRTGPDKRLPVPRLQEVHSYYLSHLYDTQCTELVGHLGVTEIGRTRFWSDFRRVDTKVGISLQSEEWHIELAELLNNDDGLRIYFSDLKIIPVEGDEASWVSSRNDAERLFIPSDHNEISSLPRNIGILSIPQDAARNEHRRRLFETYGARGISGLAGTIAKKIGNAHSHFDPASPQSPKWTTDDLINHALFLFRNRTEVPAPSKLWVATKSDGHRLASATFVNPIEFGRVPVLHQDYYSGLSENADQELLVWMSKTFRMPDSPRLVMSEGDNFILSPEAKWIAQNCDSFQFLDLLRLNWSRCSHLLTKGMSTFQGEIWNQIVSTKIRCRDSDLGSSSQLHPLHKTLMPSKIFQIPKGMAPLPLLPIPPEDRFGWEFLGKLGVKLRPSLDDWLNCLVEMRETMEESPDEMLALASSIYSRIEDSCQHDDDQDRIQDTVRTRFQNDRLIFTPSTLSVSHRKDPWARAAQCILSGDSELTLRHSFRLQDYAPYDSNRNFFLNVVKIDRTWDLKRLRQEADQFNDDFDTCRTIATRDDMVNLFLHMSKEISRDGGSNHVSNEDCDALRSCLMLPIHLPGSGPCFNKLVAADQSEEWFIADRQILLDSFSMEAPLLALSISQLDDCVGLLSVLRVGHRRLSRVAAAVPTTEPAENTGYAARWLDRAQYIDRLALEALQDHSNSHTSLRNVEIKTFCSEVLAVKWVVQSRKYCGTVKYREAVASLQDKVLSIYVQKDSLRSYGALVELAGDICDIFHIPDRRRLLVLYIMAEDDTQKIEAKLQNEKVPKTPAQELRFNSATNPPLDPLEPNKGMHRDEEILTQSTPKEASSLKRREKLESLPIGRRLQESTIEELLSQVLLPTADAAQGILNSNTLALALEAMESVQKEKAETQKTPPSATVEDSEQNTPLRNSRPKLPATDSKPTNSQKKLHLMEDKSKDLRTRIIEQCSGSLEASMLFRQSAQTNTFYVTRREDLPDVYSGDGADRKTRILESRLRIPQAQDVERALYALLPTPMESNNKDAEFLGQTWVSQLLSNNLGLAYHHEKHWKGPLRSKIYPSTESWSQNQSNNRVPFKIQDEPACRAMTRLLIQNSFTTAKSWIKRPPAYYIDVATTSEDCHFPVEIEMSRFNKVRECSIRHSDRSVMHIFKRHINRKEKSPKRVFIFVRLFHVNGPSSDGEKPPRAAFYIDPWNMYTNGDIDVSPSNGKYSVSFRGDPTFFVDNVRRHTYNWRKLESDTTIRLLRLEKGQWSNDLEGTFQLLDLNSRDSEALEYTAISYAWGSSLRHFPLQMTDSEDGSPILLQTSLFLALRRLRREDRAVLVWADAVCINQTDDSEKSKQIPLLPQIFQSAQEVFAWLGEEEDESSNAMEFLKKLGDWVLAFSSRTRGSDDSGAVISNSPDLPQVGDAMWIAVWHLLKRSWFSRSWIVQEAVLAAKLIMACGAKRMPWEVLHTATALCFMTDFRDQKIGFPIADQRTQKNILQLGNIRAKSRKDGQFSPCDCMFNLLQLFHQKEVTKPRDRLFALLGMAQDGTDPGLRPTYEVGDEDVLVQYGSAFVKQGHGLSLLYQARKNLGRDGLPSWMPDLTAGIYPRTVTDWGERTEDLGPGKINKEFKASGDGPKPKNQEVDGRVLLLQGWEVDEIVRMGDHASNTHDIILFIEEIFHYIDRVCTSIKGRKREEIRCRLPIGDTYKPAAPSWNTEDRKGRSGRKNATREDAYHNMLQYLNYRRSQPSEDEEIAIQEAGQADSIVSSSSLIRQRMWPYYQTVIEFAQCFQPDSALVCETKEKRVGIVPEAALPATDGKPGDKIVIFQGAKVPYIIRESENTPGSFRAIGECYIDGVMHGELFKAGKPRSGHRLQEFRLE